MSRVRRYTSRVFMQISTSTMEWWERVTCLVCLVCLFTCHLLGMFGMFVHVAPQIKLGRVEGTRNWSRCGRGTRRWERSRDRGRQCHPPLSSLPLPDHLRARSRDNGRRGTHSKIRHVSNIRDRGRHGTPISASTPHHPRIHKLHRITQLM